MSRQKSQTQLLPQLGITQNHKANRQVQTPAGPRLAASLFVYMQSPCLVDSVGYDLLLSPILPPTPDLMQILHKYLALRLYYLNLSETFVGHSYKACLATRDGHLRFYTPIARSSNQYDLHNFRKFPPHQVSTPPKRPPILDFSRHTLFFQPTPHACKAYSCPLQIDH